MNYLVILPNNLGDVIMATPVLEGLKCRDADAHVTFLVEKGFEAGVENNPYCDNLVLLERRALRDFLNGPEWKQGIAGLRMVADRLNSCQFDHVINLAQHAYISHLVSLLVAETFCGRRFLPEANHAVPDAWSQYLFAIPFARRQNALHATDVYRRIAGVGAHNGYSLRLTDEERDNARAYLEGRGIDVDAGRCAVFQPGAASPAKCWPMESFIELGRLLRAQGWQILISGAPVESDIAAYLAQHIGEGCVATAGATTFREAMANVSFATACVSGDTALMHAASALGVEVFALFGPTNPVETGPYGDGHWVFSAPCADRPCFCRECKSHLCMKSVLPQTVFSCIVDHSPGHDPRCDIYRTSLKPGGDYTLLPAHHEARSYLDREGAAIIRALFDPAFELPHLEPDDIEISLEACDAFAGELRAMEEHLCAFLETRDRADIRAFETRRQALATTDTVAGFLTAVLNIQLNSVPLLDAAAGVSVSRDTCRTLRLRVEELVKMLRS